MRTKHQVLKGGSVIILALAAALLIPEVAQALTNTCGTIAPAQLCAEVAGLTRSHLDDCDSDGIPAKVECDGFTLASPPGIPGRVIAPYTNGSTAEMLDPTKPDLFFMATNVNGAELTSGLMYDALGGDPSLALKVYSSGLQILTHKIKSTETITGVQRGVYEDLANGITVRAASIVENLSPTLELGFLGSTREGKPNDLGIVSTIYTPRIKSNVDLNCPTTGTKKVSCTVAGTTNPVINNASGTNNGPIIAYYIKQVIGHEMGHGSKLATDPTTTYHYTKSGTVMDPAVSFSRGVYTIPTGYYPIKDATAVTLK